MLFDFSYDTLNIIPANAKGISVNRSFVDDMLYPIWQNAYTRLENIMKKYLFCSMSLNTFLNTICSVNKLITNTYIMSNNVCLCSNESISDELLYVTWNTSTNIIDTINNPTMSAAAYASDFPMFLKKCFPNAFISFIMSSLYININNKSNKNITPIFVIKSFVLDDVILGNNIGTNMYNKKTPIPLIDLFKFFILLIIPSFTTFVRHKSQ